MFGRTGPDGLVARRTSRNRVFGSRQVSGDTIVNGTPIAGPGIGRDHQAITPSECSGGDAANDICGARRHGHGERKGSVINDEVGADFNMAH
jgi:hypothetical protein